MSQDLQKLVKACSVFVLRQGLLFHCCVPLKDVGNDDVGEE